MVLFSALALVINACQTEPRETEGPSIYSATLPPIEGAYQQPDRVA